MDDFNFKEVAEKCLSRELSGTIILLSNDNIKYEVPSKNIVRSSHPNYPYNIKTDGVVGCEDMVTYYGSFNNNGYSEFRHYLVSNFIPDNDMNLKERSVKLSLEKAIEWYEKGGELKEVALQAFSEDELKKVEIPQSWEDYCRLLHEKGNILGYVITDDCSIRCDGWDHMYKPGLWRSTLPSKVLAEKFLAYMQLMSLRKAWIGDWEPDWTSITDIYCIHKYGATNTPIIDKIIGCITPLSFPTEEMAKDFLNCFKDLLEEAKGLY